MRQNKNFSVLKKNNSKFHDKEKQKQIKKNVSK